MNRLFHLAFVFLKLGAITFGGGIAMLPEIKRNAIKYNWIKAEDWESIVTLSQLSPGAIAVNCANIIGYRVAGRRGSLVAVGLMMLPPVLIITLLAFGFQTWLDYPNVIKALQGMILAVFILFTQSFIQLSRFGWQKPTWFLISAVSFGLVWFNILSPLAVTIILASLGIIWVRIGVKPIP
jgi:chromate transporter